MSQMTIYWYFYFLQYLEHLSCRDESFLPNVTFSTMEERFKVPEALLNTSLHELCVTAANARGRSDPFCIKVTALPRKGESYGTILFLFNNINFIFSVNAKNLYN